MRAFQAAKKHDKATNEKDDDYISKGEFRVFLLYLR